LADALKLFTKEKVIVHSSNEILFIFIPVVGFSISLILWFLGPRFYNLNFSIYALLLFFCITGLNVYITALAG